MPLMLTRNAGVIQEMNGNHNVKLNSNICYFVSFHIVYPREASRVKRGWQEEKKMTHAVHTALEDSPHAGIVIIIYNIDLLDSFKKC